MSDIPFRFKNRISQVTGFVPAATGLSDGEFFVQQADKAIIFKDLDGNLVQIKNLQTGSLIGTNQTGAFAAAALTGVFVTTGQTGAFGGGGGGSGPLLQATPASGTYCGNPIIVNADSYLQTGNLISGSNCALILNGRNSCILNSDLATILAGGGNCADSSTSTVFIGGTNCVSNTSTSTFIGSSNCSIGAYNATVIGQNNKLNYGGGNVAIGYCNCLDNGYNNFIFGNNNIKNSYNSQVYIIGTNIDLSAGDSACTLYVNNLCVYDGIIYGNGSGITGLNIDTSSFVTTDQTGSFGSFGTLKLEENNSLKLNSSTSDSQSCRNFVMSDTYGTICSGSHTNFIFGSYMSVISGGSSSKNLIFGGSNNKIAEGVTNTATFGGDGFSITNSNTVYSQNFCSCLGAFYGNGSGLTGLNTGTLIGTNQTGAFVARALTGSFITTGQTGAFGGGGSINTGTLVGTDQTGNFLTLSNFKKFTNVPDSEPPDLATSNFFTILNGCFGMVYLSCYATILNGRYNSISSSDRSSVLNGCANETMDSTGVLIGNGRSNLIYNSYNSSILNGSGSCIGTAASGACYSTIINGCRSKIGMLVGNSMIVGSFNCICDSKNSVYIFGSNITGSEDNTTYVNNICSNRKYYGDGSALTGLATGSFITTGQTGAFGGGGSIDTGSFVTTGQTGNLFSSGTNIFLHRGLSGSLGQFAICATVVGGSLNCANGQIASIFGGLCNSAGSATSNYSTIIGSVLSCNYGTTAIIAGGYSNRIGNYTSYWGGTFAGKSHCLDGNQTTIIGGNQNCINICSVDSSMIASQCSRLSGAQSAIIGGNWSLLTANNSIILGGISITGNANSMVYGPNYCATGVFYGNASGLTGYLTPVTDVASTTSLTASNYNSIIRWTSNSSGVFAIPSGLTSYPVGGQTMLAQIGTGAITITGCAGVTLLSSLSKCVSNGVNSLVSIIKTNTNEYILGGDLI